MKKTLNLGEQLVEHHKEVDASPEVATGRAMPGYGSYVAAMKERVEVGLPDEPDRSPCPETSK
ncbi:hypothetical protein [Bradyrhizobium sp. ERR14]|uniref:hypothetical protein n=1 Tax=Bradyrhizobium sp. ERR14 TaxID=2663837 RepID=UPI0016121EE3|nr:hypothetical protein [Bradyrhizobium sp. ERR14]MBB4398545.1 hypothetical protein [Bradyrhizobium sp. ERR14]